MLRSARLAFAVAALSAGATQARAQETFSTLRLVITPSVIAENAGPEAGFATMYRDFAEATLSQPLTVKLTNSLPQTLGIPSSVTIPSGQKSVTFPISITDDTELNGTRTALVTASANDYFDTYFAASISDDEAAFDIKVSPERIAENGGRATVTISRAVSSANVAEEVLLSASGNNVVELPEKISFAAGQAAATFEVLAKDNDAFDGTRTITLTANRARSSQATTADLILIDNELNLTLDVPASFAENAPAGLFATVSRTRAAAAQGPVTVGITSSDASEVLGSLGVVMAKGQTSVRVPLQAIDDGLADGAQSVSLSAIANEYNSDAKTVSVTDNDRPDLQLSLNTASVSESTEPTAWGTLRRNTPTTAPVTVALRSSSPRVTVPASVTIPAGAVEVRFPLLVVDNATRDGNVSVSITASAAGFPTRTAILGVFDNDGPSLQISLTPSQVLEGISNAAQGVVTRLNTPLSQALNVTLSTSDRSVAFLSSARGTVTGPNSLTLTIPAGQSSVGFVLTTPDDAVPTDLRTATISATASGLNRAAVAVDVRDNEDQAELRLKLQALISSPFAKARAAASGFNGLAVEESAGPLSLRATVTRNTATTSDLIVQLAVQGDLAAPPFVVIPFGQSSISFDVTPIDDDLSCLSDFDKPSQIIPSVAGYQFIQERIPGFPAPEIGEITNSVLVVDDEPRDCPRIRRVSVKIVPREKRGNQAIAEIDGVNAATIIVQRGDVDSITSPEFPYGLVVDLVSSAPERAAAVPGLARNVLAANPSRAPISPARITLLPGRVLSADGKFVLTPAEVPLTIVNDQVLQRCTSISITPVVVGYVNPSQPTRIIPISLVGKGEGFEQNAGDVPVLDTEREVSKLTFAPSVINESGASGVATGVVRRAAGVEGPLTVTVRSLNDSRVGVSPIGLEQPLKTLDVLIPDGQLEASFNIIARDNLVNDGDVTALLEASTACSTTVVRAPIVVRDNDLPQLSMSITLAAGQKSIAEGMPANGLVGMVQRSGNLKNALTVALRSSDTSELVVPAQVTIPAGASRATFTPRVVDDALVDGPQKSIVSASAIGQVARPAQISVIVADNEKPVR